MEFNKKINRSGGVTLPSALRRELGIEEGEKLNIKVVDNGDIVLKRVVGACVFCGSDENLKVHKGRFACKSCRDTVSGL
ncbi:AbrB/MazE/SpoVT family DNA-binding domain-containing protein [Sporomusa sp. KB1]|jgi:transcriptional pleiotropic regulator of transition state genes|uniref:AbrB/MazE/SpoVT family DNA-binding domain-containing protein n=1 Tax=Sporomusa sp. KB1 TaxID=943346 RepID=UPI00119F7DD8|nr:AbrB/MazE/SpoVT family DNA-binding domain-containing protein [Sporomusa sp. KB1]TWH45917.1 AbrB family looped-hinge helix DNA binding protein [Sporomusa sp. KB1]